MELMSELFVDHIAALPQKQSALQSRLKLQIDALRYCRIKTTSGNNLENGIISEFTHMLSEHKAKCSAVRRSKIKNQWLFRFFAY